MCSFANTFGGVILLGVQDDGEVLGVSPGASADIIKNISSALANPQIFSPTALASVNSFYLHDKEIIAIDVTQQASVCSYKKRIYRRVGESNIDITNNTYEVEALYRVKSNVSVEDEVLEYATMSDLEEGLFKNARNWASLAKTNHPWVNMSNEELLKSANLIRHDPYTGKSGLTLAAILLFGKKDIVSSCLPSYKVDATYHETDNRFDDRYSSIENLMHGYNNLIQFICKHTDNRYFNDATNLTTDIRTILAKEIVANLLMHRGITSPFPSTVKIYKDRLIASNPNKPLHSGRVLPENLEPLSKNPRIAAFFRELGWADELGSGMRNILRYSRIYTGYDPTIVEGDKFVITLPLAQKPSFAERTGLFEV